MAQGGLPYLCVLPVSRAGADMMYFSNADDLRREGPSIKGGNWATGINILSQPLNQTKGKLKLKNSWRKQWELNAQTAGVVKRQTSLQPSSWKVVQGVPFHYFMDEHIKHKEQQLCKEK